MTVPDAPPRHPLRFPDFRAYLVGRLCAVLAQYGMMIVLGWQAYNIARETMTTAGASAQLGLIGLAQFLPLFFLTPITGWVADHFDRRIITRITLSVLAAASGLLAFATYEGWVSLPLIFGMAVIVGTARAFNGPAYGALAPNLVPLAVLPNAIAISSVAWQAGMIAGPALGGYAYAATPWGAYAMAAGLFTVALGAMLLIGPVPQPPRQTDRHPIRQMIDGFAYVKGNRLVLATITLDLFAVLLAGATALLPVYARDILHVGSTGLGHLAAAPGIGAAVTALWFSFRPMKSEVGLKMLGAVILFGIATIIFGSTAFLSRDIAMPVGLGSLVVLGGADMVSVFVRQSLVQLHTPDAMRGRVSSLSQLTISASNELGEAESGFLAALVGPVAAVIGGGVGAIIITLLWSRLFPELRLARSFDPPDIGRAEISQEKAS
ncbi:MULTISPECIES: MFS transporter [Sphingobium]|jgi:MFS family permease|uniref:MFS transporter n=1 Tax=Sphingobium TaxID=165695 RepID=UPI000C3D95C4|nr:MULTISPECIES: MFS transporter [Sphingobium]MBA37285.1 MFS transporter [Sphingobium sp.]MEC9017803.1 MFS transporter [Pseudomonadota bacterium]MBS48393.1 MFS transporter [Sphingobium sp.]MCC4258286.1 MFS transporter [Sphingobium lactosutens]HCW59641.1 MFS transporter [Sphingobium sp.]|tara:strand:- start:1063 stop:2370 length:1308 start_codon:yes stop_codon:yes gene_type:complete